jgi:prolyl 4-hydroxylase
MIPLLDPRGAGRRYARDESLDLSVPLVWTVPDVLAAEECTAIVARIEAIGFEPAPITTAAGFVRRPDVRNNERVMFDDAALAARVFQRVAPTLPERMFGAMRPVGANERLRFYRYGPDQRFAPHFDGCFRRSACEESTLTLMVYLNDGFEGGETVFLDYEVSVVPRRGLGLLFQHALLHEGCAVRSGVKYVLRSDVMYREAST